MNYNLLTTGTKNSGFSFILENHEIINSGDEINRRRIIDKFNKIADNSAVISQKKSKLKINKYRDNYLIKIITINKDEKGRFAPVELLLMKYESNNKLVTSLKKINNILKYEEIILDENVWMSIPEEIENSLKLFNKKKRNKLILVITVSIIVIIAITKIILT
ncbi:hypothetical protein [Lutibacter flavus]|uniref:Uncharacterized protein n=1 Tax=Lutibacter flavus TaxID=691689 RepID=A0A238XLS1_9FLAO|nr:hypothetical protein [Lutibacter flavus]SNR58919.1 hypothetical protein SAMN04488111_1870 [Lutibacter flavus]